MASNYLAWYMLANTTILDSITSIMAVGSSIRAELYKLNVYSTGDHFKDTPRSPEMFGSLVVSLPSQFTGGALVTRHLGHTMTFDWSSSPTTTQWAAFYGDVEHEVLPVTSGPLTTSLCLPAIQHRLTLLPTLSTKSCRLLWRPLTSWGRVELLSLSIRGVWEWRIPQVRRCPFP